MKFVTALNLTALFADASAFAPGLTTPTPTSTLRSSAESAETEGAPEPDSATVGGAAAASAASAKADLAALAKSQNTVVGYYDPLQLADRSFWEQSTEATIGFLRQAEIKHGRVAMAAFVGYCVQSNVQWPFAMTLDGAPFPSGDLSPEAQWDAIPQEAKWQILAFVGALEILDECNCGDLEARPHYMRGGQPGKYPDFSALPLNLYDPFNINKKMSDEVKARRLNMEVNNGRLAMIGIFGFLAADAVPGSVPVLGDIAQPYAGNVMIPFEGQFSLFS